ncbi:hypothetical protein BN59_02748 [Legionella massiliensis]|uniref:Uncharacterized protein n=1 Tax=Legionella massiliensis TaxID=1034943 RepID=A0A078L3C4_9GAMM|nr:hypothetical protein [Legionella massiliensis]CDZ78438.1 hypothetical protein BN59_02748 [Legionella massiliensis]CEE14176.1 hypothetical protein BN1094_02748 [Legionella massiliensis]
MQHFILWGYNIEDGLGDFKHLIDFFKFTKAQLSSSTQESKLKAFAFVNTKQLPAIKNLTTLLDNEDDCYFYEGAPFDRDRFEHCSLFVYAHQDEHFLSFHQVILDLGIQDYFASANFLLNISTPIDETINNPLALVPHTCHVHSLAEYGNLKNEYFDAPLFKGYTAAAMGVGTNMVGIKFNEASFPETLRPDHDELLASLLQASDNKGAKFDRQAYLDNQILSFSYFKTQAITTLFTLFSLSLCERKDITNLDMVIKPNTFDASLLDLCKKRFTQIEFVKLNTENKVASKLITQHPSSSHDAMKRLRLIDINTLTQPLKLLLLPLSSLRGGCGDNSYSELMIPSELNPNLGFPLFEIPGYKLTFFYYLLQNLQENFPDSHLLLQRYLHLLVEISFLDYKVINQANLLALNELMTRPELYNEILCSWQTVKVYLFENYNVHDYFQKTIQAILAGDPSNLSSQTPTRLAHSALPSSPISPYQQWMLQKLKPLCLDENLHKMLQLIKFRKELSEDEFLKVGNYLDKNGWLRQGSAQIISLLNPPLLPTDRLPNIHGFFSDSKDPHALLLQEINSLFKSPSESIKNLIQQIEGKNYSLALRNACNRGEFQVIQLLMKYQAQLNININEPSKNGNTALDWLNAFQGNGPEKQKAIELLQESGALCKLAKNEEQSSNSL